MTAKTVLKFIFICTSILTVHFTHYSKKIKIFPDYLKYFPKGAFEQQVKYITEFYLGKNNETKENFVYLTKKEMDCFISMTTEKMKKELIKFKVSQPDYINIDDTLRLRKFDEIFDFALPWYLDEETVKLVDGKNAHIYDEKNLQACIIT